MAAVRPHFTLTSRKKNLMFTSDVCWGSLGTSTSGTQVQPQAILDPDYLPDYLSVSYDYV